MIPQISGKLFFLFLLSICAISSALAQKSAKRASSDTIVIYETKVVYDTLYVYDTIQMSKPIKNIPALHLGQADTASRIISLPGDTSIVVDTFFSERKTGASFYSNSFLFRKPLNVNFIIPLDTKYRHQPEEFLCKSPATNLKKSIISLENDDKLMESKKHISNRFGISAGGGGWWAQSSDLNMRSDISASPNIGIFYERVTARNVCFKVEINYSWLLKKGITIDRDDDFVGKIYSSSIDTFSSSFPITTSYSDIFTWEVNGEKDSEFSLSQISIPVKLGYKIKSFQPYVGFEYKYSLIPDKEDNGNTYNILAGIEIHLSSRLSAAINYAFGIEEELDRTASAQGRVVGDLLILPNSTVVFLPSSPDEYLNNNTGMLSTQRIDFSLYLNLSRPKNKR